MTARRGQRLTIALALFLSAATVLLGSWKALSRDQLAAPVRAPLESSALSIGPAGPACGPRLFKAAVIDVSRSFDRVDEAVRAVVRTAQTCAADFRPLELHIILVGATTDAAAQLGPFGSDCEAPPALPPKPPPGCTPGELAQRPEDTYRECVERLQAYASLVKTFNQTSQRRRTIHAGRALTLAAEIERVVTNRLAPGGLPVGFRARTLLLEGLVNASSLLQRRQRELAPLAGDQWLMSVYSDFEPDPPATDLIAQLRHLELSQMDVALFVLAHEAIEAPERLERLRGAFPAARSLTVLGFGVSKRTLR